MCDSKKFTLLLDYYICSRTLFFGRYSFVSTSIGGQKINNSPNQPLSYKPLDLNQLVRLTDAVFSTTNWYNWKVFNLPFLSLRRNKTYLYLVSLLTLPNLNTFAALAIQSINIIIIVSFSSSLTSFYSYSKFRTNNTPSRCIICWGLF